MGIEESSFNVRYFGALGDGVQDDFPSFQRALQAIDALIGKPVADDPRGAILQIPVGVYRLSRPLRIARQLIIQGAGRINSSLIFYRQPGDTTGAPLAGIVIERQWETVDNSTGKYRTLAAGTVIRDLMVATDNSYSPLNNVPPVAIDDDDFISPGDSSDVLRTSSGIILFAQARIENCYVQGFEHDGIHINSSVGWGSNPGSWQVDNCFAFHNGRHGLFVSGGDANVGVAINLTCSVNCRWGIYDRSFLGNTYLMCHVENNGHKSQGQNDPYPDVGGGYRSKGEVARNLFIGCYSELGQRNVLRWPAAAIAGLVGDGFSNDPAFRDIANLQASGELAINSLQVNGSIATKTTMLRQIASGSPQQIEFETNTVLVDASSGNVPLILPKIGDADHTGYHLSIKKIDAGTLPVAIAPHNPMTESIDGEPSILLDQPYSWVSLVVGLKSLGSGSQLVWYVLGRGSATQP